MKISIKKISEVTGFSPATISNALNNKKGVNKETSETIFKTARELGYFSENKLNHIKFVSIKKHGKVVGDTPFFHSLIEGVEKEARIAGLDTLICNLHTGDGDYAKRLREILSDGSCGLLILATELSDEEMAVFDTAAAPVVIMDSCPQPLTQSCVMIDNEDSMYLAAKYLASKGHTRIGYLKSSISIRNFYSRYNGYQRAMSDLGLTIRPQDTIALEPTTDGAYRDMNAYLHTKRELPTALLADNDIIALGAMKALQEHGCRLPEDISVIGFDDLPFCEISTPPLSTVRVPKQELGRTAVRRLLEIAADKHSIPLKIQIGTTYIARDSVLSI